MKKLFRFSSLPIISTVWVICLNHRLQAGTDQTGAGHKQNLKGCFTRLICVLFKWNLAWMPST